MSRSFLLLLGFFLVAEAATDTTAPDIDVIIDRVKQFLRYSPYGTTNSSGFQKLQDVTEDKVDVTGLFDMLGDLFTNGTVGRYEDKIRGLEKFRRLYINTNMTNGTLNGKLIELCWEACLTQKGRDVSHNEPALRAVRTAFQAIISRSKAFYDELNGATAAQLSLQYPFDDHEVNDTRCYFSKLDELCSELGWNDDDVSVVDHTMRLYIYDIAKKNNYSGGESNRCFHKFFIRHHNYSKVEYDGFADHLAYYLADERAIYGFCTRLQQARNNVISPSNSTITAQLTAIRERLLEAQCILTEKVSPCPTEETSMITDFTGLLPEEAVYRRSVDEILREDRRKCVPRVRTTTEREWIFYRTTSGPQRTREWADIASSAAVQAIGDKSYKYPAPDSAVETYRAVGMLMIALLDRDNDLRDLYEYKAVVFYPANDDSEYCIRNGTGGDVYWSIHNNVRFLLARYNRSQLANETWLKSLAPEIQQTFSDIDTENLCERLKKIDERLNGDLSE